MMHFQEALLQKFIEFVSSHGSSRSGGHLQTLRGRQAQRLSLRNACSMPRKIADPEGGASRIWLSALQERVGSQTTSASNDVGSKVFFTNEARCAWLLSGTPRKRTRMDVERVAPAQPAPTLRLRQPDSARKDRRVSHAQVRFHDVGGTRCTRVSNGRTTHTRRTSAGHWQRAPRPA